MEEEAIINMHAFSTMSKKRFQELKDIFSARFQTQDTAFIMTSIQQVLRFDPLMNSYTKEKGIKVTQARKQKAIDTGTSVYVVCGQDKRYARKKNNEAANAAAKQMVPIITHLNLPPSSF